jgi:hypothetical protein
MSVHGQFAASQVESSTSTSHKNNTIIVFTSKKYHNCFSTKRTNAIFKKGGSSCRLSTGYDMNG